MVLAACGSGGSDTGTGNVRMLNLTRAHPSLDLLVSSSKQLSAVASYSASTYTGVTSGNNTLQVADAGTQTALVTTAPSVAKDQYYSLLVYESNSALKTAWLAENDTAPSSGSSNFRVFNVATDAGALDVYVIPTSTTLAAGTSPYFVMSGTGTSQISAYLSFTPGTYQVIVTASGNQSDVRLYLSSITLADTALTTVWGGSSKTPSIRPYWRSVMGCAPAGGLPVQGLPFCTPLKVNSSRPLNSGAFLTA